MKKAWNWLAFGSGCFVLPLIAIHVWKRLDWLEALIVSIALLTMLLNGLLDALHAQWPESEA